MVVKLQLVKTAYGVGLLPLRYKICLSVCESPLDGAAACLEGLERGERRGASRHYKDDWRRGGGVYLSENGASRREEQARKRTLHRNSECSVSFFLLLFFLYIHYKPGTGRDPTSSGDESHKLVGPKPVVGQLRVGARAFRRLFRKYHEVGHEADGVVRME